MSFVANKFTIFRLLTDGGPQTDQIAFNDATSGDFKDSKEPGAYLLTLERTEPEGIGNNQAAEKPDGNVQPLGIVEGTYVLKGFITDIRNSNGNNPFLVKLHEWKEEPQVFVDELEAGRFGFIDDSDNTNSLTPVGTGSDAVGLIFENFQKIDDYGRNRAEITLTFRRSRGIDI